MKLWYGTEFIEAGNAMPIELISIGMAREDGQTLYLVNADVSLSKLVRNPWLQMNVLPHLPIKLSGSNNGMLNAIVEWDTDHPDISRVVSGDNVADMVRDFVLQGDLPEEARTKPELWAEYGAYDHVVLCQMFGTMVDLPPGFPMYTNDIIQEWNRLGQPTILPPAPEHAHDAMADALWVKDAWHELDKWDYDANGGDAKFAAPLEEEEE